MFYDLIIIVLIILFLSGLCSGLEAALLSSSIPKIKAKTKLKKYKASSEILIKIKEDIHNYIITLVLLNNIVNIGGSIIVGNLVSNIFSSISTGIFSAIFIFLIILFAEIVPKTYGEIYSVRVSLFFAKPLYILSKVFYPFICLFDFLTKIFVVGKGKYKEIISEDEILEVIKMGKRDGAVSSKEKGRISNVLKLNDKKVKDVMVKKQKVIFFDLKYKYEKIIDIINKEKHTRYLVKDKSKIVGFVNVKDIIVSNRKKFNLKDKVRETTYVYEELDLEKSERTFKKNKVYFLYVLNSKKRFVGILTFKDLIEEVFGEIEDEFDN